MRTSLTELSDRTVKALKPRADRAYDRADRRGLYIRVEATGSRVFWFRYQFQSRRKRLVIGHYPDVSLAEARDRVETFRRELARGIDPQESRKQAAQAEELLAANTVSKLLDDFIDKSLKISRRRPEWAQQMLNRHVRPELGEMDPRQVGKPEVWRVLDAIGRKEHASSARHIYALLRQLFAFAIARGVVERNPVDGIRKMEVAPKPPPRSRVLSDDEIRFLWRPFGADGLTEAVWLGLKALLATGQRRGELRLARWPQVNLEARTWTIPPEHQGKKKRGEHVRPHVVPLSPLACEIFSRLKELAGDSEFVLPSPLDPHRAIDERALTRAVGRKGVTWTPHDLRRTCRTRLSALKTDWVVAEKILNHEVPGLQEVYDRHDYAEEMRAALDVWGEQLRSIAATEAAKGVPAIA